MQVDKVKDTVFIELSLEQAKMLRWLMGVTSTGDIENTGFCSEDFAENIYNGLVYPLFEQLATKEKGITNYVQH